MDDRMLRLECLKLASQVTERRGGDTVELAGRLYAFATGADVPSMQDMRDWIEKTESARQ